MAPVTAFSTRASGPAERVAGFVAHLRENGLALGPADTAAALRALCEIDATDPGEVRSAMRALTCRSAEDIARFDELFAAYWFNRGRERQRQAAAPDRQGREHQRSPHEATGTPESADSGPADSPEADSEGGAEMDGTGRLIAARMRNLMRVDLRELVRPEDIASADVVAERIARAIRDRRSRRQRAARRGKRLDMRRIIRACVSTGGDPLRLFHRRRPDRPARLVAVCDVSGSMAVYARVFLAFLRGLAGADAATDAYLFHTRLVRITDALHDPDHMRAVNRLSLMAQGFGGGTRIGGALADFNRRYARRLVSGRSVVIVLSDGYDTDPPEVLGKELARLRRRGCRIVWLNPLKGWKDYAPVAGGMAAALPHLDLFAAANTLGALAALEPEFARI